LDVPFSNYLLACGSKVLYFKCVQLFRAKRGKAAHEKIGCAWLSRPLGEITMRKKEKNRTAVG
jgi:hypothetical protein